MTSIGVKLKPAQRINVSLSSGQDINVRTSSIYVYTAGYIYEQAIASAEWYITHNLNKRPSVTVVDSAENVITPEIVYIDNNNVVVRFNGATTGKAYLN